MMTSSIHSNSNIGSDDLFVLSLRDLPEDLLRHVAQYLTAPDILRMLCVHPHIHKSCGSSSAFWNMLSRAHDSNSEEAVSNNTAIMATAPSHGGKEAASNTSNHDTTTTRITNDATAAKEKFLLRAYTTLLPRVRWIPISNHLSPLVPDSREGHLACRLGTKEQPIYIFNGGFTDDANVYCLYKPTTTASAAEAPPNDAATAAADATWLRLQPSYTPPNETPSYVYGATLTRLDDRRAIRFGGFQSGGYTGETNQVAVLTVDIPHNDLTAATATAHWQVITNLCGGVMAQARAYHTATLLQERYLLIVGGMTSGGSILQEAILDTHTWQWFNVSVSISTFGAMSPSGRHGHSIVVDNTSRQRNRLVLFGGGNGTDLLRSGTDNTEVWELNMGEYELWKTDLVESLPWRWNQLYTSPVPETTNNDAPNDTNGNPPVAAAGDHASTVAAVAPPPPPAANSNVPISPLSLGEGLCLGRCHLSFRVSPNSVVFAFGSGRPSTNAVVAYDLRTDTFLKPRLEGPFPRPRFTATAVLLEDEGYLLFHGGYSTQMGDTTHEFAVLDLAPAMQRPFDWLPVRTSNFAGHPPVACDDVRRMQRTVERTSLGQMLVNLTEMTPEQRQHMAVEYMGAFMPRVNGGGGREAQSANLLRIIMGARAAQLPARQHDVDRLMESLHEHMAEEEEFDEDDDDEDYDDEDDEDEDVDDDMSDH